MAVEGVAAVTRAPWYRPQCAVVLGSNLEGPWIARSRAGAQFPGALRPPSTEPSSMTSSTGPTGLCG